MKLLKSIGHILRTSATLAVVLIAIVTLAAISLASIWLVCLITGIPFGVVIVGICAGSLVIGCILEAVGHGKE